MKKADVKKCIIAVVLICVIALAGYGIFKYFSNASQEKSYTDTLRNDNIEQLVDKVISYDNENSCPINVDFDKLNQINKDIVAWIYCENTPVNYPVLQGVDNGEYMYNRYDKTMSTSGSIYLDYRNNADFSDLKSIIYGHNLESSMFGTLTEYKSQEYYQKHPTIWLITPKGSYALEIFAGFELNADSSDYDLLSDTQELKKYITDEALKKSDFDADCNPSSYEKIVALSTSMNSKNDESKNYIVLAGIN